MRVVVVGVAVSLLDVALDDGVGVDQRDAPDFPGA